jgi:hypothetical protein
MYGPPVMSFRKASSAAGSEFAGAVEKVVVEARGVK